MDSSLESSSSDGFVAGDIEYVAPEVLENPSLASAKADIWSFGVVLFEMLTGRRPARGQAVDAALAYLPGERASDAQTLLGIILKPEPKIRPAATTVLERVQDARQERCYAKMLEFVNDEVEEVRVRQAERAMVEEQVRDAAAHDHAHAQAEAASAADAADAAAADAAGRSGSSGAAGSGAAAGGGAYRSSGASLEGAPLSETVSFSQVRLCVSHADAFQGC